MVPTIVPVIVILAWWLVTKAGIISGTFLPTPGKVGSALLDWTTGIAPGATGENQGGGASVYNGYWLRDAWASGFRVLLGFSVGSALGLIIGTLLGYFPLFRRAVEPLIHMLRAIPIIGWLPLSLVFFGFGLKSAVFLVALGCFFPVVVNTMSGVQGVSLSSLRVGSMMGASRSQQLRFIIVPSAMPSIITGLRVAMGFAWILVIVAEWLAVRSGLGYTLLDAYRFVRYDYVIAAMISIGAVGFLSDKLLYRVSLRTVRWHTETTLGT